MSTVQDRVVAAMLSAARQVEDVPPLRLEPGADTRRRAQRTVRHRVLAWATPLAAAVMVAALAAGLVTLRSIQGGRVLPPGGPAPFVNGVPRYYAALVQAGGNGPDQVQIRETLTGQLIATVHPPAGSTFAGITGAADDRTWVVDAQPGVLEGPAAVESQPFRARSWYLLRLSPGSPEPPALRKLPIPATAQGTDVDAIALSPDGAQLAMGYQPDALDTPGWPPWLAIYSVATGALVRQWASNAGQHFGGTKYSGPDRNLALAWTKDGTALLYGYSTIRKGRTVNGSQVSADVVTSAQIRLLPTRAGGADLDLASKPVLSLAATPGKAPSPLRCGPATLGRIVLAADRGTLLCAGTGTRRAPGPLNSQLCAPGPAWNRLGLLQYSIASGQLVQAVAQYASACAGPLVQLEPLWSSADGKTQLAFLGLRPNGSSSPLAFGVLRDGRFTRLPMPAAGHDVTATPLLNYVAW